MNYLPKMDPVFPDQENGLIKTIVTFLKDKKGSLNDQKKPKTIKKPIFFIGDDSEEQK
jgi:hypothetical protein